MPKFIVVKVDGRKETPVKPRRLYPSAEEATQVALDHMKVKGHKYQIRPVIDANINWRDRESQRLMDGTYKPVPWANCAWVRKAKACVDHFVHVSHDDPTQIAYTSEEGKGLLDKQARISPTKYLARHYMEAKIITEATMRKWLASYRKLYGADYELKFAYTGDDIVRVFKDGPSSCMKGVNAVRAYEGPDLAVAYIERSGKITARTVVWPKKKLYCDRTYGDIEFIQEVLEGEGYKASHHFKGARLSAIKNGSGWHLPSVEMAQGYTYPKPTDKDQYIIIK